MILLQESRRFKIYFYGTITAIVWLIVMLVTGILRTADLYPALRVVIIATLGTYVISFAIDRWLWRLPPFRALFRIPDFSGRWEGWYWNTIGKKWLPNVHEINQCSLHISVNSWGLKNWSRSNCATVFTDSSGGTPELVWSYDTVQASGISTPHRGTAMLRLINRDGKEYLEGTYYTDRQRDDESIGQGGFIRLIRVGWRFGNELGYEKKKESWGMPKPESDT